MRTPTILLSTVAATLCLSPVSALANAEHHAGAKRETAHHLHHHLATRAHGRRHHLHVAKRHPKGHIATVARRRLRHKTPTRAPAPVTPAPAPVTSTGGPTSPPVSQAPGPFFTGTFSSPDKWPSSYGNCSTALSNSVIQFNITTACNPANNGHYRTDLCSSADCNGNGSVAAGDLYQAGQATCTSVPVNANSVPTVPTNSWMMFAEAKDNSAVTAGWAFMLNSHYGGANEFSISFGTGISNTAWVGTMTPGWHTLSICTNNANNSSGEVYGIYEDGQQLTFNHGDGAGQQSISGFPIIDNGMASWPLDIDDYTGGTPANTIQTGAPLVSNATDTPPMPTGGWNNA